jgi:hypothetical protein
VNTDAREDSTRNKTPFAPDEPPLELLTHCRSATLSDGCDAIQEMDEKLAKLLKLHAEQMSQLKALVKPIGALLHFAESPPAATVSADQPNTNSWADPNSYYPSKMIIRVESKDGFARLETSVDVARELPRRVKALKKAAKDVKKSWFKALAEAEVRVPPEVLVARKSTTLSLSHKGRRIVAKDVPVALLTKYIKRDQPQWAGVASYVIDLRDLSNVFLSQERVPLAPAMTVVRPGEKGGGFSISVSSAKRERHIVSAKIMGRHFCDTLRAEMRFVHAAKTPPKKIVFRAIKRGSVR